MPAIAALTINDGAATPVAHTFSVSGTTGSKATWLDKVSGIPVGYSRLEHEVREAKSATGAHRVVVSFSLPTLATVDGVQVRVRVSSAQLALNFAQDSTLQERKDMVAYVINALSDSTVKPSLYNIEGFY